MTKPLRQAMPFTASIIDDFRANWPEACIEKVVRAGMNGQPTFHARENGHEIGTPIPYDPAKAISGAEYIRLGQTGMQRLPETTKGFRRG